MRPPASDPDTPGAIIVWIVVAAAAWLAVFALVSIFTRSLAP